MDHGNIQACEITYRVSSGKAFQVTRTHPEPREVLYEDSLTRRLSRSSADTLEGQHCLCLLWTVVDGDILLTRYRF